MTMSKEQRADDKCIGVGVRTTTAITILHKMNSESPPTSPPPSSSSAVKGVLYSILLRLLSFSLSQITIRLIEDPRTLGYSTIQLELLCSTSILFLSREGFRLSLVRMKSNGNGNDNASPSSPSSTLNDKATYTTVSAKNVKEETTEEKIEDNNGVSNVAWLTIPFGTVLTIFAFLYHLHKCSSTNNNDTKNEDVDSNHYNHYDYKIAGIYYCIATLIEIISEPCMIHCLQTFNVTVRAKAEGIASICKALATVILLSIVQHDSDSISNVMKMFVGPVSAFGIAQIVYAVVLSVILYQQTKHELYIPNIMYIFIFKNLTASSSGRSFSFFDKAALKLSVIFTFQSIFKHLLTEGDRIILSTLVSSYNSGIYAMVSSYGSIVSRMILLPLEENGRLLFSHYHAEIMAVAAAVTNASPNRTTTGKTSDDTNCNTDERSENEIGSMNNNKKVEATVVATTSSSPSSPSSSSSSPNITQLSTSIEQLETTYIVLVKFVLLIGCFFITFGSNYTATLLQILAGSKWGNNHQASFTLSIYCSYILCMACNGMTEAFVYGVVDDSIDVGFLSIMHGSVGIVFYVLAPMLVLSQGDVNNVSDETIGGTVGLIFANEICMILRSLYSIDYAANYFYEKKRMVQQKQHYLKENDPPMAPSLTARVKKIFSPSIIVKRMSLFYYLTIQLLPSRPVLLCFVISFKATRFSKYNFLESSGSNIPSLISIETLMHIFVGILFLLITLFIMYLYEKEFGRALKSMAAMKPSSEAPNKKTKVD